MNQLIAQSAVCLMFASGVAHAQQPSVPVEEPKPPAQIDESAAKERPAPPFPPEHVSYIEQIRRQVNHWWQQNIDNLPAAVRVTQASYTTVVRVILGGDGALEVVDVVTPSGSPALDDAIVRAFRMASPFATAPAGLVQKDGRVYLPEFEFTLHLSGSVLPGVLGEQGDVVRPPG